MSHVRLWNAEKRHKHVGPQTIQDSLNSGGAGGRPTSGRSLIVRCGMWHTCIASCDSQPNQGTRFSTESLARMPCCETFLHGRPFKVHWVVTHCCPWVHFTNKHNISRRHKGQGFGQVHKNNNSIGRMLAVLVKGESTLGSPTGSDGCAI